MLLKSRPLYWGTSAMIMENEVYCIVLNTISRYTLLVHLLSLSCQRGKQPDFVGPMKVTQTCNSRASRRWGRNLISLPVKLNSSVIIMIITCETLLRWILQYLSDDKSTFIQMMVWCHQINSHELCQYLPRSMLPYGVTRLQRVEWCSWNDTKELGFVFNQKYWFPYI